MRKRAVCNIRIRGFWCTLPKRICWHSDAILRRSELIKDCWLLIALFFRWLFFFRPKLKTNPSATTPHAVSVGGPPVIVLPKTHGPHSLSPSRFFLHEDKHNDIQSVYVDRIIEINSIALKVCPQKIRTHHSCKNSFHHLNFFLIIDKCVRCFKIFQLLRSAYTSENNVFQLTKYLEKRLSH